MSAILAIGAYDESDRKALEAELGALLVPGFEAMSAIAPEVRAGVTGVAYLGHARFGASEMDLLPGLRMIANFGVGFDAIDVEAATVRGITVTNTPDVLSDDVADLAVAMLLAQSRQIPQAEAFLRDGDWHEGRKLPLSRKVSGRRIGILGLGRIGHEIATRLAAFKAEIHYFSRREKSTPSWTYHADPRALAAAVDDLVIAVVGGTETEGLVSAEVIGALGPDGVIVNIARGSVVDEAALILALERGLIRGAALDVFRNEPKIDRRFLALKNVLLLPHIGSATVETRAAMGALQRQNLVALIAGKPALTPVNRVQR